MFLEAFFIASGPKRKERGPVIVSFLFQSVPHAERDRREDCGSPSSNGNTEGENKTKKNATGDESGPAFGNRVPCIRLN